MLDKWNLMYFENCIGQLDPQNRIAMLDIINMNKKQMVLAVHKNKISQLQGKDKRWHTYVKIEGQKRAKEIKAATEADLIQRLLDFYGLNPMSFQQLYEAWIEYKETVTESPCTIRRHGQHFTKYFVKEHSKLLNMNVCAIDKLTLQSECNRLVKKYGMSRKEWQNVKTILNGMFEYAYDKHAIRENPCEKLKITVKYKQVNKAPSKTQVYLEDEYEDIHLYLDAMYEETKDPVFLAVKLQFFTGVRVGELVALKWCDVDFSEKKLHILRQESNQPYRDHTGKWHDRRVVVSHTKTHTDRFIPLLPKTLELLMKFPQGQGFLFTRNGKRITERQVNYVLEKYAQSKGASTKSSHKLRKTYASRLDAAGVSLDEIRKDLGHKEIGTTLGYLYNPLSDEATYDLKANAI